MITLSWLPACMPSYQHGSLTTQHLMGLSGFLDASFIIVWKEIWCFCKCTWWDLTIIYWALVGIFNAAVFVCLHQENWRLLSPDCQLVCQAINSVHSPTNTSWSWQGFLTLLLILFENKQDVFEKALGGTWHYFTEHWWEFLTQPCLFSFT